MENSDILEIERTLLACIVNYDNAIDQITETLKPESFSNDLHEKIYAAMQELFMRSEPIDILLLINMLKKNGTLEKTGGGKFLRQYLDIKTDLKIVPYLVSAVQDEAIKRDLRALAQRIHERSLEPGISGKLMLGEIEEDVRKLYLPVIRQKYKRLDELVRSVMSEITIATAKGVSDETIPSGFKYFDQLTGGFRKGNLSIIGSRPGMGKTAFLVNVARHVTFERRIPAAYFSFDCNAETLTLRLIAQVMDIPASEIRKGNVPMKELEEVTNGMASGEIPFYADSSSIVIKELIMRIRTVCMHYGIQMVIIDYLQLIGVPEMKRRNRVEEIDHLMRTLKQIAKELNISIVVSSQLSRAVESRGGSKRPILSDLRESGTIEDEADMVIFIYRPEYYKIEYWEDQMPTKGCAEIIVGKNRNGALCDFRFSFNEKTGVFKEVESIDRMFYQDLRQNEFEDDTAPF